MQLTADERALLEPAAPAAQAMAMRIVRDAGRLLGADSLVAVESAHIDGCLYHGDSGVYFLERLVEEGGRVAVPSTLNVGALDLLHPELIAGAEHQRHMARRLMDAHTALGCMPTWTCAPYQTGHRPAMGTQVAWGESNAVVFVNSVLGARTNRYGDFLDIACALVGRAPDCGLHRPENRLATVVVDLHGLPAALKDSEILYPVLGSWLGRAVGDTVAALDGLPGDIDEDRLKALGAGAAATGAVGLFHVVGVTPEAPDRETVLGGMPPRETIPISVAMLREERDRLDRLDGGPPPDPDCIALGSPHFSADECRALARLADGARFKIPVYVCTSRAVLEALEADGTAYILRAAGAVFVTDTCVVVTPILRGHGGAGGVMLTNSAKFAHYGPGNTGYRTLLGSLADCVATAVNGRLRRDDAIWEA